MIIIKMTITEMNNMPKPIQEEIMERSKFMFDYVPSNEEKAIKALIADIKGQMRADYLKNQQETPQKSTQNTPTEVCEGCGVDPCECPPMGLGELMYALKETICEVEDLAAHLGLKAEVTLKVVEF